MGQVCSLLGLNSKSGANYTRLRKLCDIHNISLEHFDARTFRKDSNRKKCSKCKESKNTSEFWANKRSSDGLQGYCKSCGHKHTIEYHNNNKDRLLSIARDNKKKRVHLKRDFVISLLKKSSCVECSEKDIRVLDFDHKDPLLKIKGISQMIWDNTPLYKLKKEIEKCDIRCANCHRKRTFKQFNWYKNLLV